MEQNEVLGKIGNDHDKYVDESTQETGTSDVVKLIVVANGGEQTEVTLNRNSINTFDTISNIMKMCTDARRQSVLTEEKRECKQVSVVAESSSSKSVEQNVDADNAQEEAVASNDLDVDETDICGSSNKNPSSLGEKGIKRMAQEIEEGEEQSSKRKKWINNLILSSDDEDEALLIKTVEEKQKIFDSGKEIFLRFPYYMGSDDSDDEEGIKYFPGFSSSKKDVKKTNASSDESNEISNKNKSYKHAKRKNNSTENTKNKTKLVKSSTHMRGTKGLCNKENREDLAKGLVQLDYKVKDSSIKYNSSMREGPKKLSLRQRSAKASGSVNYRNVTEEEESCSEKKEFQPDNQLCNRFLDSSSEASNAEITVTKTRKTKYKRVRVLSTSPSGSDNEDSQNPKHSRTADSDNDKLSKTRTKEKHPLDLSSDDENDRDSTFDTTSKAKDENLNEQTVESIGESGNSDKLGVALTKPIVNKDAWRNIAIANINPNLKKQSKIEKLKRKFVPSNASSVAIYKKIQSRENLENRSEIRMPVSRSQLNKKIPDSHKIEPTQGVSKSDNLSSTGAHQQQEQLLNSTCGNQVTESSDPRNKSPADSDISVRRNSLTENMSENVEDDNLPKSPLQSHPDTSLQELNTKPPVFGKKIRYAHNRDVINKNESSVRSNVNSGGKLLSLSLRKTQALEKISKTPKKNLDQISSNFDLLGNIMSQMDNNRYKVQKPVSKPVEPTPTWFPAGSNDPSKPVEPTWFPAVSNVPSKPVEPTWFPAGSNVPSKPVEPTWFPAGSNVPLCGQVPRAPNSQTSRMYQFQSKHNLPVGVIPPVETQKTSTPINTSNPSYNPLYSAVTTRNDKQTVVGDEKETGVEIRHQKRFEVSKPVLKEKEIHIVNTPSNPSNEGDEGKFVSFYSAPQEDYGGNKDVTAKNDRNKLKTMSTGCKINKPSSLPSENPSDLKSEENKKTDNNLEQKASNVPHNNTSSKEVSGSGNVTQIATARSSLTQFSNIKNNVVHPVRKKEDSMKKETLQPHAPCRFTGGIGAIRKEFRENNLISNNNNAKKGVRIRLNRKEFRLPATDSGAFTTKKPESNAQVSVEDNTEPDFHLFNSGVRSLTVCTDEEENKNEHHKTEANKTEETVESVQTVSSSSTSSSSTDDSSSSTDDSSSESSDESVKSNSSGCSTLDGTNFKESHKINETTENCDKSDELKAQTNITEQIQDSPNNNLDLSLQPTQDPIKFVDSEIKSSSIPQSFTNKACENSELIKNTILQICNTVNNKDKFPTYINTDEVIVISGSSDSDSNEHSQDEEIRPQKVEDVSKITVQFNKRVENLKEDFTSSTQFTSQATSQVQQNELHSNKVGKIRVKTLKELGVFDNNPETGSSLAVAKVHDVSKTQMHDQLDPLSDTAKPTKRKHLQTEKINSVTHVIPETENPTSSKRQLLTKKPTNPVTTIYLPVVPIAVIKPVNAVNPRPTKNQHNKNENLMGTGSETSLRVEGVTPLPTQTPSQTVSQNSTESNVMPTVEPSEETKNMFFKLYDELFTDVVLFKFPKLVDDLHLLIDSDIVRQERLKRIGQLLSPDIILSEKRRAEKDFADAIKVRGHSFVPLFMTILNRIDKKNLKTLITAVYCRLVHQLERLDAVNANYRFKIRTIIKSMLEKHSAGLSPEIMSYFDEENDFTFCTHFKYVEDLLRKYDERQEIAGIQPDSGTGHTVSETEGNPNHKETQGNLTNERNEDGSSSVAKDTAPLRPPPIGNLDEVFLMKPRKK